MAAPARLVSDLQVPDQGDAGLAAEAVGQLAEFLRAHPTPTSRVRLCADEPDGDTQIVLPSFVLSFLIDVLAQVANGNAVTVAPVHAELTTQQAADLLNVSRPFLIKLLEDRRIPYRRVGNRRKVLLTDLLDYKRKDDEYRRGIADELTREAQDLGLDY
jgi:excisionase family DNA binding protein